MPASTSPDPAVASHGASLMAMAAPPIRRCDGGIRAFRTTVAPLRRAASRVRSGFDRPMSSTEPNSLANSPSCGVSTTAWPLCAIRANRRAASSAKLDSAVGVEHDRARGRVWLHRREHGRDLGPRRRADAETWTDADRVQSRVGEHRADGIGVVRDLDHDRGQGGRMDRQRVARRGDGDETRADPQGAPRAEPRCARPSQRPGQNDGMAALVFVPPGAGTGKACRQSGGAFRTVFGAMVVSTSAAMRCRRGRSRRIGPGLASAHGRASDGRR